jgi:hypothetical protein
MENNIEYLEVTEGNLRAVKCTDDFGGPNMWRLYVKRTDGFFDSVQWMYVGNVQKFFSKKLPVYEEAQSEKKYKLIKK